MKIAVLGLEGFSQGKKPLSDERLKALEPIVKPSKTTFITLELLDVGSIREASAIICEKEAKLDLIVIDLEIIENRLSRLKEDEDPALFQKAKSILEGNLCLSEEPFTDEEKGILVNTNLVSIKPVYFVDKGEGKPEGEILFNAYRAFGMISFITGAKDKELRSWSIRTGTTAVEAAGVIHSDIQRGFIKAEIVDYDLLIRAGSVAQAKASMHLEGKEYIMKDCDFVTFRFNV